MDIYKLISEGKLKRYFRARRKLNYPGLISHITQRAAGKGLLFVEDADYLYMLKLLKEINEDCSIKFLAFCLLSNHLHLLIQQTDKNLSEAMHKLFMRYAIYFNHKYHRIGHLFGGAFRQAACFDDYYLLAASAYIHLNPVRAALVGSYNRYRWSSWRLYCKDKNPVSFVDYQFILKMLDEDISKAKKKYRDLLNQTAGCKTEDAGKDSQAIGKFSRWIHKLYPGLIKDAVLEDDIVAAGYSSNRAIEKAMVLLKGKGRLTDPKDKKAREFAILQLKSRGFSAREIADYLGITHTTVYLVLKDAKKHG